MIQTTRTRAGVALAALSLLAACSSKKDVDKPAELTDFTGTVKVVKVWSASVNGAPKLRVGLAAATDGKAVYAAGYNGVVSAFDVTNGKKLWQAKTKLPLTGGAGVGDGIVVAGASHGDIVALDAATGAQKWKTRVNSEIIAAPAVGGGVVLMRMSDGSVIALRTTDGTEMWSAEQTVPQLSLRGTAKPVIAGTTAFSGFDNGHVMALTLSDGTAHWDVNVAPPTGRSEIERLNDMDSTVKVVDNDVYAVNFHGKAVRIDRETGQVLWGRDVSSYAGLATDDDSIFVSGSNGDLVRIARRSGVEVWKQEVLANRRLSPPVVMGSRVVVADFEGYVHVFDVEKGELAGRIHAFGKRVSATPLVSGDMFIMMDDEGKIMAMRITPVAAKS